MFLSVVNQVVTVIFLHPAKVQLPEHSFSKVTLVIDGKCLSLKSRCFIAKRGDLHTSPKPLQSSILCWTANILWECIAGSIKFCCIFTLFDRRSTLSLTAASCMNECLFYSFFGNSMKFWEQKLKNSSYSLCFILHLHFILFYIFIFISFMYLFIFIFFYFNIF